MNKNEQETSATKEVHVSFIKKKSSNSGGSDGQNNKC